MIESLSKLMSVQKKRPRGDDIKAILNSSDVYFPKSNGKRHIYQFSKKMNDKIVNWLSDVAQEPSLHVNDGSKPMRNATIGVLFCALEMFYDVVLHFKGIVDIDMLQCVAVTSFVLAAKAVWGAEGLIYEANIIDRAVYLTDNAFTKSDIINMEHLILEVIDFRVCGKTQPYMAKFKGKDIQTRSQPKNKRSPIVRSRKVYSRSAQ
jgi:hypothetical protein